MPNNYNISTRMLQIDPALIKELPRFYWPDNGLLRDEVGVPISPVQVVDDTTLFEEPKNPASKYFLPSYRISTERTTSGSEKYRMAMEERAPGWCLRIHLEKYPSPMIEKAAREAKELNHQVTVILRYYLAGFGGVQKELVFGEITAGEGGFQVVVQLNSLAERDELYYAMTQPDSKAELIIRRSFRVAIQIPSITKRPLILKPIPVEELPNNWSIPVEELPIIRPFPVDGPPIIRPFSVDQPVVLRKEGVTNILTGYKVERVDGGLTTIIAEVIHPPRYRENDLFLEDKYKFFFPDNLHSYIYGDITTSEDRPGLIRHQVYFDHKFHSYYQETSRPYLFYYLPDSIKLARQQDKPYLPCMWVGFTSKETLESSLATLDYMAIPVVDQARLEAASKVLESQVDGEAHIDKSDQIVFQPLLADTNRMNFRLSLPGMADLFHKRDGAMINLKEGIVDSLTLPLSDFQAVFDALMASETGAVLMTGEVEVSLDDQHIQIAEKVPFIARMNDMAGEVFDYNYSYDPVAGVVNISLRNEIESPIQIKHLGVELRQDQNKIAGQIQNLTFPIEQLAPGAELSFQVAPVESLSNEMPVEVNFDLDGIKVLSDREAIWNVIQKSFTAQYQQVVTVKTLPAIFNLPQNGNEEDRLGEILVELKRGDGNVSVSLTPEKTEVQALLPFPMSDVILKRENSGEYQYRVTSIRLSGAKETDWKVKNGDPLFILQKDVM